ncbi:peptidase M48 [Meridianimarinicoccus roseus]|uniref:Peptidase M48 n=1 Tax=Meridianimarinicoccus roseus TaxID=2072018 RepID=A0A2V2LJM9_9RHOB|nr:M48 family metalloprotease [Meridianimarinicoccus roseus]PWR03694.1 peptidase M48 [Meridianimarinicoccus roseus]
MPATALLRTARIARAALLAAGCVALSAVAATAQGLLRDAGIEHGLDRLARPILTAAGLPANRTRVLVVNDTQMNAFVVDSRTIFVTAGLIMRLENAAELQAVIAHEAAHIANGHFARRGLNAQYARNAALVGLAAGVAAGAASGNPGAGVGIALGTQSSAMRNFLSHTREEEAAADKSGMRYLAIAGVDPFALRGVLQNFAGQETLTPGRRDPYAQSHPLSRERLRSVDLTAAQLTPPDRDRADEIYWFDRLKAKLSSYLRTPAYTMQRYGRTDTSDAAVVARAMAHHKSSDLPAARAELATLLERHPEDAYLHELLGWMELEWGNVDRAIDAYARAAELDPREALIQAGYGRALLARGTAQDDARALDVLSAARARDPYDGNMLRDLSIAHAKAGENGLASLATAERYALQGKLEDAGVLAARAAGTLPVGSPAWSRAQDLIRAADMTKRR